MDIYLFELFNKYSQRGKTFHGKTAFCILLKNSYGGKKDRNIYSIGNGLRAPEGFFRETKLIGINAGHYNSDKGHSGISYFYKSSVIKNIIDKMMKKINSITKSSKRRKIWH